MYSAAACLYLYVEDEYRTANQSKQRLASRRGCPNAAAGRVESSPRKKHTTATPPHSWPAAVTLYSSPVSRCTHARAADGRRGGGRGQGSDCTQRQCIARSGVETWQRSFFCPSPLCSVLVCTEHCSSSQTVSGAGRSPIVWKHGTYPRRAERTRWSPAAEGRAGASEPQPSPVRY